MVMFSPDSFHVMVGPIVEPVDRGLSAAFGHRTVISAACGVGLDLIRRAPHDVNPAAIRSPPGNARGEPLIGVGDAAVVLFLEFVFDGVRGGIAPLPECLDELLALFVGLQLQERRALFVGNDVGDFLFQPFLVGSGELFFELPQVFLALVVVLFLSGVLLLVGGSVLLIFILVLSMGTRAEGQQQCSAHQQHK